MKDLNQMGELVQFFWAVVDSTKAALIGLNLMPVFGFALLAGAILPRGRSWLKAPLAVAPAMLVIALWPLTYGAEALWPDFMQMEVEIQTAVQFVTAWAVIWLCDRVKMLFAPVNLRRPIVPVVFASES